MRYQPIVERVNIEFNREFLGINYIRGYINSEDWLKNKRNESSKKDDAERSG